MNVWKDIKNYYIIYNIELQQARWGSGVLMLGQRHRRWASIETSLFQRVVFVHFRNLLNAVLLQTNMVVDIAVHSNSFTLS